jgi:hypothetical protein
VTEAATTPEIGRLTKLLPIAVIAAAVCLFASELMTMFEFTPPGGEALCAQDAGERHSNAQMVIAAFAVIGTIVAVYGRSRPASLAVAAMGVLALLIFLISDLRVVNTAGSLSESCGSSQGFLFEAEAVPQGGFYLELLGALALTVTGLALATLTPEQLGALRLSRRARPTDAPGDDGPTAGSSASRAGSPGDEKRGLSRLGRRPRARQRG